jgi:hypothetical protein
MVIALALLLAASHPECLRIEAIRLERSGENSSDVADAVITACVQFEDPPSSDAFKRLPLATQERALRGLREVTRDAVRLRVVRIRACRNTTGCNPGEL